MSLTNQTVTIGTITRTLLTVPNGQYQLTIVPVSGTVFVGAGTNTTTANGFQLPSGGFSFPAYQTSIGGPVSVVANGSPAVVQWWLSTAAGALAAAAGVL